MADFDKDEVLAELVGTEVDPADREVLERLFSLTQTAFFEVAKQTAESSRWLLASLLGLNGGSAIALLQSSSVSVGSKRLSLLCWAIGLFLALATGFLSMNGGRHSIKAATDLMSGIATSLHGGRFVDLRTNAIESQTQRRLRTTIIVGLLSGAAWTLGVVAAGVALAAV